MPHVMRDDANTSMTGVAHPASVKDDHDAKKEMFVRSDWVFYLRGCAGRGSLGVNQTQ